MNVNTCHLMNHIWVIKISFLSGMDYICAVCTTRKEALRKKKELSLLNPNGKICVVKYVPEIKKEKKQ